LKPLGLVAAGAVTSVSLSAVETAFALRASAMGMRESPLLDPEGKAITMCFLPTLDPRLVGLHRAFVLAARALADCVVDLGPASRNLRARIVLAMDENADRAFAGQWNTWIDNELTAYVKNHFAALELDVVAAGPGAPARILPALAAEMEAGGIDVGILGGAHTDYDPSRIAELSRADRLFSRENLDSVMPGESAAFIALMRPDVARRHQKVYHGNLLGLGAGISRARPDNDVSAFSATGLASAMNGVLGELGEGAKVGWFVTDLGLETFRHFELHTVLTRLSRFFCEPQTLECPAQRIGYLGASAMALELALIHQAFRRGFAPYPRALAIVGSDGGERVVVAVEA